MGAPFLCALLVASIRVIRMTYEGRHRPALPQPQEGSPHALEIANTVDVVQNGKVYIELISGPSCVARKTHRRNTRRPGWIGQWSAAGWCCASSGTFVQFTQGGAELFA